MAVRLKASPVGIPDISEYLKSTSDFSFELSTLKLLRDEGLHCDHAGLYDDPVTGKPREFDIRACVDFATTHVDLAVECKNVRENFPLVVSCVPRHESESVREVMLVSEPPDNPSMPGMGIFTSRATAIELLGDESLYPTGASVGKSVAQVGRQNGDGTIVANDSEIYEKWGQCLSSLKDLLDAAYWTRVDRKRRALLFAFFPIIVVPDGRLWRVDYNDDGAQTGDPRQVDRCAFFVNKNYAVGDKNAGTTITLTHVEMMTTEGLLQFVRDHLKTDEGLRRVFPEVTIAKEWGAAKRDR